jgi:diguanylate cyclase (GGDEF)-like protein
MPVEKFSQILTSRVAYSLRDDFIITDQGLYFGTGTVIDLLRKVTDLQICNARYANPLTQLPGNVPLSERLNLLIEEGREFSLCHFDIDNFKPYNDVYGFSRGDEVIRLLGNLLVEEVDPAGNFIGHIGGDDFVVIFTSSEWEGVCRGILERFAREILTCYDPEALSAGGISGCNRKNQEEFFEIMSLSIGAVTPPGGTLCSPGELASRAAEAKTVAKQMPGNALFIDRRQIDGD